MDIRLIPRHASNAGGALTTSNPGKCRVKALNSLAHGLIIINDEKLPLISLPSLTIAISDLLHALMKIWYGNPIPKWSGLVKLINLLESKETDTKAKWGLC